jgi:pyruvate/2-oxoglutarate dehydrogenase complex dihydrolipoamide dehydrogenase (E3) component
MTKAELRTSAYDAIIIGTGQAGPALAGTLAAAGMTVAIVERALFGGTCVNTGCIPTKTLIASAYAIHMARRAADFGVMVDGPVRADIARIKARKDAISGQSRVGVEEGLKTLENCTIYRGHARFVSPHEVQVGEALLTAERIFINVGGRAVVPSWPGLDQVAYLTNASMMAVDFLPRHLVVVGGGYVGLEFAQMYRRFGSEVTVVEMGSRLIQREDPDVSAAISGILELKVWVYGSTLPASESRKVARASSLGSIVPSARPRFMGHTYWSLWANGPTPTIWASIGPAYVETITATSSSMITC